MDPFVHIAEQQLVVCSDRACQYAVLPSNINTHLKDKDTHNMVKEDRDQIMQEVQKIEGLIQHKWELNSISFQCYESQEKMACNVNYKTIEVGHVGILRVNYKRSRSITENSTSG